MTTTNTPTPTPLATTGRLTVNDGDDILASWGNTTFDQTVECFASPTDRDAQWAAPHDGAVCYTADQGVLWVRKQGIWVAMGGPAVPVAGAAPFTSFTDGGGEVWVAKGGVNGGAWRKARDVLAARMYRNTAYTFPVAPAAMPWNATDRDPYGLWVAASTGFVIPLAGLWRLVTQNVCAMTAASQSFTGSLNLNAATKARQTNWAVGNLTNIYAGTHDVFPCNAGDVVSTYFSSSVALSMPVSNAFDGFATIKYEGTG